jgi:hypothetical protein
MSNCHHCVTAGAHDLSRLTGDVTDRIDAGDIRLLVLIDENIALGI